MANASDLYIMQGASGGADGKRGIVPKPVAGDNVKVLKGDATFGSIVEANITAGTLTVASTATGSKTGNDSKFVTGTAGSSGILAQWDGDGDLVTSSITATQALAGQLVKVTEATLGSDSTVTATSATASGLQINYTPISSTNDRYIEGTIDWQVSDTTGNQAQAFALLEYSSDGSSWSTLQTFTNNIQVNAGKKLVGVSVDTIPSQISTTSTTLADTGLQVDYTAIAGANDRYVEIHANCQVNRNASVCEATLQVQYFNGSTWVAIYEENLESSAGGASSTRNQSTLHRRYLHQVSDDTPQYKAQYRVNNGTSSETFTLFPGESSLTVSEYALDTITTKRQPYAFRYRDTVTTNSPYYRLTHYVSSGDESKIYTGSTLRISEYSDL